MLSIGWTDHVVGCSLPHQPNCYISQPILTMMEANANADDQDNLVVDTTLNGDTAFVDIKCDDEATQYNNVYCSIANENFRAGECVEFVEPIRIGDTNFYSNVGCILRVDQRSNPQRVLVSLFLTVNDVIGIAHHQPPLYRERVRSRESVKTRLMPRISLLVPDVPV
jgi:hypothetical protein